MAQDLRAPFSGSEFAEDAAKINRDRHGRPKRRRRQRGAVWALLATLTATNGLCAFAASPHFRNTDPTVAYTGSAACTVPGCHAEIGASYGHSPHGLSMTAANVPLHLGRAARPVTVHNPKNDRYYTVYTAGGELYQSVYALDGRGRRLYEAIHKIDYATGGERTGYTYLFHIGRWIFQAPLSYYVPSGTWELSPGYAADDVGFTRVISTGCLLCHNGQPAPEPGHEGMYRPVAFRFGELGVSCESCHGPGALHVREMQGHEGRVLAAGEVDTSIVNPAKLPPRLADDICRECHQAGDAVVDVPGRTVMDFRPGEPLSATMEIVRRPIPEKDRAEANRLETAPPVRGSLEQPLWWKNSTMELSRCYTASHGKLTCMTCHATHHGGGTAAEQRAAYRAACLGCHTAVSCTVKQDDARRTAVGDYCIECHMEKRPVAGIAHSNDTKHRIVRYAGQPLPETAFEQPRADLPGLLWLNRPENGEPGNGEPGNGAAMPEVAQLTAYWSVARKDGTLWPLWLAKLKGLSRTMPEDPRVLEYEGALALGVEKNDRAAAAAFRAALAAGASSAELYLDLADAELGEGELKQAEATLEAGLRAFPYSAAVRMRLAQVCAAENERWRGRAVLEDELQIFPEDDAVRKMLGAMEAGDAPAAAAGHGTP